MGEHHYDGLGICVLCGMCDDPRCCADEGTCDGNIVVAVEEARTKLKKFFRTDRAGKSDR